MKPPARITPRQFEVLSILVEFDSECWGDAWTHVHTGLSFQNFDRVANAIVRKGLVRDDGNRLEVTDIGKRALYCRRKP